MNRSYFAVRHRPVVGFARLYHHHHRHTTSVQCLRFQQTSDNSDNRSTNNQPTTHHRESPQPSIRALRGARSSRCLSPVIPQLMGFVRRLIQPSEWLCVCVCVCAVCLHASYCTFCRCGEEDEGKSDHERRKPNHQASAYSGIVRRASRGLSICPRKLSPAYHLPIVADRFNYSGARSIGILFCSL